MRLPFMTVWKTEGLPLRRMSNHETKGSALEWVKTVKIKLPRFSLFMDYVVASRMRFGETANSWNLIIGSASQDRLSVYYNSEKEVIEHFRFRDLFIRGNKKLFVTFLPRGFIERIAKDQKVTQSRIDNALEDVGLKCRFGCQRILPQSQRGF